MLSDLLRYYQGSTNKHLSSESSLIEIQTAEIEASVDGQECILSITAQVQ